jgi:hypothetical protein
VKQWVYRRSRPELWERHSVPDTRKSVDRLRQAYLGPGATKSEPGSLGGEHARCERPERWNSW